MCQISSVMAAAEGPVAEFSGFANFEEKKRKSNLLMSFPKIVNQMGSFGQKRKKCFFRICRPILDIFGFTLLMTGPLGNSQFCFPRISMFPETKSRETLRFLRNKNSTQNSLKQNSLFSSLFSSGPGLMIVLHDFYFPDQDDYSYSSADFRLKIFW